MSQCKAAVSQANIASALRVDGKQARNHLLLGACFTLVYCLAYSSALNMETIRSTENLVDFHRATRRCVPQANILNSQCCGNSDPACHRKSFQYFVAFEILTDVVMKSSVFWDITPCGPLKVDRCFGRSYRRHLQG
jgi:hypothetical protein